MSIKRPHDRAFPLTVIAWALALLLLPPMACSGATAPSANETGGDEAESTAAQGDLIARLPADATTVGMIDFAALRNSPAYEFLRSEGAAIGDPGEFEDLIAETGIDPRTDLHRIAFVSSEWFSEDMGDASGAVVVATFDRDRVLESMAGQPTEEYGGHTLYAADGWGREDDDGENGEGADEDGNKVDGYLAILDDSTLAFGGGCTIRAIIDVANGAASTRTNTRLMALLEDVDPDSETWFVSAQNALFKDITPDDSMPMQQIPLDRINAMIISLRMANGIQVSLRGRTEESSDAKLLGDSLNGMLAFGKMMIQGSDPDVFSILDRGITAGSSGRDVTLRADLSIDDLETLRDYAHKTFDEPVSGDPGE